MPRLERGLFIFGVAVLSFGYGFATYAWDWFPKYHLKRGWDNVKKIDEPPIDLYKHTFNQSGWRSRRPDDMESGMTLVTSSWKKKGEWKIGLKLFDSRGTLVHEWLVNNDSLFPRGLWRGRMGSRDIHGSLLLPDGDVVVNIPYSGMARLNSCSDTLWTLPERNHHSISKGQNGTFWVPGVSQERRAKSDQYPEGFPGLDGKKVWLDRILKVGGEGEVLRDINVLDVLYENGLERYFPKTLGGKRPTPKKIPPDLTHLNDVEPLDSSLAQEYPRFEAGDLLVSLRSSSLVFVFDPTTRKVKWHASQPFTYQHDPDFVGNGWIGVFDNNYDLTAFDTPSKRGTMLGGNRVVGLQPHADSTEVWFPTAHSERVYTDVRGKWQKLENGNMLLTEANAGRAVEVDSEGRIVWEWIHRPTQEGKVPSVSKVTRYNLSREEVADWPCTSVPSRSRSSGRE